MDTEVEVFFDRYMEFLVSGEVHDFVTAGQALSSALNAGATVAEIQACMDASRTALELLVQLPVGAHWDS